MACCGVRADYILRLLLTILRFIPVSDDGPVQDLHREVDFGLRVPASYQGSRISRCRQ